MQRHFLAVTLNQIARTMQRPQNRNSMFMRSQCKHQMSSSGSEDTSIACEPRERDEGECSHTNGKLES
jgi:hypothetical protein